MSNLIPTHRTDKNGRTITRHMKPQSTGTANNTAIPVPTMSAPKDRATIVTDAAQTITDHLPTKNPNGLPEDTRDRLAAILTNYSDATLERIQQHDWTANSTNHFHAMLTYSGDETEANDYMAASAALKEYEPNGVHPLHYGSWQHYPELHPANNEGDYPEERLNQLTALYVVTEHMIAQGEEPYHWDDLTNDIDSTYLEEGPLRDFLLNPGPEYNRDDITSIITTHHLYDTGKIKAMLDLGVPSMTSGVL